MVSRPALKLVLWLISFSDNLRDHYMVCSKRGDHEIPETGQRGRRRHACQSVGPWLSVDQYQLG